jgi:hypothetical protein
MRRGRNKDIENLEVIMSIVYIDIDDLIEGILPLRYLGAGTVQ